MKALDFSFSAAAITPEWCQKRIAEGYELLVGNLWTGNRSITYVEQALRYWREAGGIIAGYVVVYSESLVETHVNRAIETAGAEWEQLNFVAVDVEMLGTTVGTVKKAIRLIEEQGHRAIVYTAKYVWEAEPINNDSTLQPLSPLWTAHYITPGPGLNVDELDILTNTHTYGGWYYGGGLVARQYQNSTDVDGVQCDLNVFYGPWVNSVQPTTPEEPIVEDEVFEVMEELKKLIATYRMLTGKYVLDGRDMKVILDSTLFGVWMIRPTTTTPLVAPMQKVFDSPQPEDYINV